MIPTLFFLAYSFKVIGIDCAGCAPPIVKALRAVPGVTSAKVDTKSGLVTVEIPDGFDKSKLRAAVVNAGFETEESFKALPPEVAKKLDIAPYDGKSLAAGKITVVDYYADWCGPCHVLEARLQRYMVAHPNVAVRRADIGKWDTRFAREATKFGAEALPYIRVYDARGKFVAAVTGSMWDEVLAALEKAAVRNAE
jgi:copper chaperone CopZ